MDASGNAGWIVMIRAHHYHNHESDQNSGAEYVRGTLLKELKEKDDIQLSDVDDKGKPVTVSTKQLGIDMPVMINTSTKWNMVTIADPNVAGAAQPARGGLLGPGAGANAAAAAAAAAAANGGASQTVGDYPFVIEFIWKPTPLVERQKIRQAEQQKKAAQPETPQMAEAPGEKTATP